MRKVQYNKDYYGWSLEQLRLLKKKQFDQLDLENLIEEVEYLSKIDERELQSRLKVLMMHLLKQEYQPEMEGHSWQKTIKLAKLDIKDILAESKTLANKAESFLSKSYQRAVKEAAIETGLPLKTFPKTCPWTVKELLK